MLNINKNSIVIDRDGYYNFGSEQVNISFPYRFPTVTIALEETDTLDKAADAIRMEFGYKPMFPDNWRELDPEDWDDNGWYNFYVSIDGWHDLIVGNSIEAVVQASEEDDNERSYYIPLTDEERVEIHKILDEQLKEKYWPSCDQLLEEARQEMIEYEEYIAKHKKGV